MVSFILSSYFMSCFLFGRPIHSSRSDLAALVSGLCLFCDEHLKCIVLLFSPRIAGFGEWANEAFTQSCLLYFEILAFI